MAEPARYMFDGVFALDRSGSSAATRYDRSDVDAAATEAREDGFKAGHAAGRAEAISETEQQLTSACDKLAGSLSGLIEDADRRVATAEQRSVEIALLASRKMSRALVTRYPLVEITDLFRQAVEEVRLVPHVVLHVHESLAEPLGERIERLARETGVEGRVIVLGDPDIVPGDARVEWADGGMERSLADIESSIAEAAKRFALRQPADRTAPPQPEGSGDDTNHPEHGTGN